MSIGPIGMDLGLQGKVAIVTGAAGGIGRAAAQAFARAGAKVLAVDKDSTKLDQTIEALQGGHHGLAIDLTQSGAGERVVETATDQFGSVDVLAHIAGVIRRRYTISQVTEEDWDVQLDTNLKASFFLCRAAAEQMRNQGRGGRIVTLSSQAWWSGGFGGSLVYAASKGGIVSLTRGLARTYGSAGITVNSVAPGLVRTPMVTGDDFSKETMQDLVRSTPLGRIAEPEEIASVILFLASTQASFVSGATINVSGGLLMY